MFGKLSWESIPYHEPIIMSVVAVMVVIIAGLVGWITYSKSWGYLWKEWITSVDHKKLGIMYFLVALVMLIRGFADAIMMRSQQAIAVGGAEGYLPPEHYDQIFTAHGVIMIFFVAMPMVIGLNIDFAGREIVYGAPSTQYWTELSSAIAGGLVVATIASSCRRHLVTRASHHWFIPWRVVRG